MTTTETVPSPAPGDYAIVELFGHTTLVGRVAEVERFGAKMLCIEPLFKGELLPPVYYGGGAIYGLTPCSAETAAARCPREDYHLPAAIRARLQSALPAPQSETAENGDDRGEYAFVEIEFS